MERTGAPLPTAGSLELVLTGLNNKLLGECCKCWSSGCLWTVVHLIICLKFLSQTPLVNNEQLSSTESVFERLWDNPLIQNLTGWPHWLAGLLGQSQGFWHFWLWVGLVPLLTAPTQWQQKPPDHKLVLQWTDEVIVAPSGQKFRMVAWPSLFWLRDPMSPLLITNGGSSCNCKRRNSDSKTSA